MHKLENLTIGRYRAFARETLLEFKPLTLLYGHNNAGKSALLRLLPILSDSVSGQATAPLELSGQAGGNAGYLDVVWRANANRKLDLVLGWADFEARYLLDYFQQDVREFAYIRRLSIREKGGTIFDQQVLPTGELAEWRPAQRDASFDGNTSRHMEFAGLMPPADTGLPPLDGLREHLQSLQGTVQWLRSLRQLGEPYAVIKGRRLTRLTDPSGREAQEALAADRSLLEEVAGWYRRPEVGRKLDVRELAPGQKALLLEPNRGPVRDIRLAETGEGMIQVLPVLTAIALASRQGAHATVAIEEPESHLHANGQRALAEHLCEVAARAGAPTLVLETHSRLLLLGIQLAVARDDRLRERVAIYWVDQTDGVSQMTPAAIEPGGGLRGWPPSVFSEDRALARELLEIQLAREDALS